MSVEIATVIMMQYVGWDLHMYHKESDTTAVARTSIVSDLGLVEYIFSDKTGAWSMVPGLLNILHLS